MFVLRQIHNKINTMIISISVICLMLFVTITILSTALSLQHSMEKSLQEATPVDINLYKTAYLPEKSTTYYGEEITHSSEAREDSKKNITYTLTQNGFDINNLKDIVEISTYTVENVTLAYTLGDVYSDAITKYPMMAFDTPEEIIKVSDYNKIAKLYGIEEFSLNNNEYIILCNFDNVANIRNEALSKMFAITINGTNYIPKYGECKDGFIELSTSHTNAGIILVPDSCNLKEEQMEQWFLAANYNAKTEDEKRMIEEYFSSTSDSEFVKTIEEKGIVLDGITKIALIEASTGLATIIVFIGIYLGIIFLIASSAILALKQLTESSDNKQRYLILRKIGCDEKMINKTLFRQIGIFFLMPLILAIIHSIFGIQFALEIMSVLSSKEELIPSTIMTVILIGVIYGIYFISTYIECKNIIKEE